MGTHLTPLDLSSAVHVSVYNGSRSWIRWLALRRNPSNGSSRFRVTCINQAGELSKPRKDGGGADDLATGFAFFGRQRPALDGQPTPLLVGEWDAFPAGALGVHLPEHANLLQEVLDPARQLLIDGVRHHRDNELERHRKHRAQIAAGRGAFSSLHFNRKACDNPAP